MKYIQTAIPDLILSFLVYDNTKEDWKNENWILNDVNGNRGNESISNTEVIKDRQRFMWIPTIVNGSSNIIGLIALFLRY